MSWKELDQNIWHPFGPLKGLENLLIERGEGAYLITGDGRRILDGVSSWWVNLHGHAHPVMANAIAEQALKLEQVIFAGFTHSPALNLSERLMTVLPEHFSKLFFSDDGSTAVEVALKLAIQYWHNRGEKRSKIIAIQGAYHGDTFGAMSVADRNLFSAPFDDKLFDVQFIPFPEGNGSNTIDAFRRICDEETAGFIFEPLVQGAGGMRMYTPEVLEELVSIAKSNGALVIADEIMTGFCRTGRFFSTDHIASSPDIICMSKGLTGGYLPMSITAVSENIVSEFNSDDLEKTFWHGHSYTANPLACAAAVASFDLLTSTDCQERIRRISELQADFVKENADHPKLNKVQSRGTILSMEVASGDSGYTSSIRNQMYNYFLEKDILLRPLGNVLYFLPPYVTSEEDILRVHETILDFLEGF